MENLVRKYKKDKDIITVTTQGNGLLFCETTNKQYNRVNTDGYWIATESDVEIGIKNEDWKLIEE